MCRGCDGFAAGLYNHEAIAGLDKTTPVGHIHRMTAFLLLPAMLLDAALGEPKWLWSRTPHPAVLMGRIVTFFDARMNHGPRRRLKGALSMAVMVIGAGITGWIIHIIPDLGLLEIIAVAVLLAQRSLSDHVQAVANALRLSLNDGRQSVAMIVGRDTANMDASAVARGAIESAAENLSDGVIAPILWYLVAGLPGILIYKITNTADSMIGHRTPRHEHFGWAAARLDDVLNLIPARITAALIALAHGWTDPKPILRDAPLHRSPNAGWPEAAMAVVLRIALSGPRSYHGQVRDYPWVWPEGRLMLTFDDIDRAVRALWRTWALMLAIVAVIAIF